MHGTKKINRYWTFLLVLPLLASAISCAAATPSTATPSGTQTVKKPRIAVQTDSGTSAGTPTGSEARTAVVNASTSMPSLALLATPVEPSMPTSMGGSFSYQRVNMPLFGPSGLPDPDDLRQSSFIGDCPLTAALVSMSGTDPQMLKDHLQLVGYDAQGDNIYDVTLYAFDDSVYSTYEPENAVLPTAAAVKVRISDRILVDANGITADAEGSSATSAEWCILYEKAMTVLLQGKKLGLGNSTATDTGYNLAMDQTTYTGLLLLGGLGKQSIYYAADASNDLRVNLSASAFDSLLAQMAQGNTAAVVSAPAAAPAATLAAMKADVLGTFDGRTLTLPSGTQITANSDDPDGLIATDTAHNTVYIELAHVYALEGTDPNNAENIVLHNPWNLNDQPGDARFSLNKADFLSLFADLAWVALPAKS